MASERKCEWKFQRDPKPYRFFGAIPEFMAKGEALRRINTDQDAIRAEVLRRCLRDLTDPRLRMADCILNWTKEADALERGRKNGS